MQDKYGCAIVGNGLTKNVIVASSIAHEIGHTIGLLHTFNRNKYYKTKCFQECVSRTQTQETFCFFTVGSKKCEVNGDALCDTDADIMDLANIGYDGSFASCSSHTYDVSSTNNLTNSKKFDNYGDQWYKSGFTNAMDNLMSYWPCHNNIITPMQQGVMYHYIRKANNSMKFNADVDFYENDNFFQPNPFFSGYYCNIANINSKQYHTFHLINGSACDIDWIYFQNSTSTAKSYVIQTSAVSGKPQPDTKITLYSINTDGTLGPQLATNDNISGTNLFSKITTSALAAYTNYAIKIENNITNVSDTRSKGHYFLRVDACYDKSDVAIVGDNVICTSKQYLVSNLPAGATVSWVAAPAYVTINTSNNVATLTKSVDGKITLKATISYCGETYVVTKENIAVGLPYVQYSYEGCVYPVAAVEAGTDEGPCNTQCYSPSQSKTWCAANVYNATNVTWQKIASTPANYSFWSGSWSGNNNFVSVQFKSPNQYVELKTTMTNTCPGSTVQYYCFGSNTTACPSGMMMMAGSNQTLKIYPNPTSANTTISLELYLDEQQIDFENSTIQLINSKNKVILEKTGKKVMTEQLDIPIISSGTYYVNVTNNNGTVSEELVISSAR